MAKSAECIQRTHAHNHNLYLAITRVYQSFPDIFRGGRVYQQCLAFMPRLQRASTIPDAINSD